MRIQKGDDEEYGDFSDAAGEQAHKVAQAALKKLKRAVELYTMAGMDMEGTAIAEIADELSDQLNA